MERRRDDLHCLLEFLIRSSLPHTEEKDKIVRNMLRIFSSSNPDSGSMRTFLLQIIQNHLSSQPICISENLLKVLEYLEQLFRQDAFPVPATMSAAYCAVAIESTIKYLHLNLHRNPLYLRAVKKIWQGRIRYMNSSPSRERSLLLSVELERWKKDIESSLLDSQLRERLVSIDTRKNAIIKLRAFFDEACTILDSSFAPLTATEHTATEHTNKTQGNEGGHTEHANDKTQRNEEGGHTEHANKIQRVEKIGDCISGELQALAKDSLTTTMEDNEETYLSCSSDMNDNPMDINDEVDQVEKDQVENAALVDERNSVDNLQVGTSRFNLHSPEKRKHSPLKIYKPTAMTKRRKTKRWSQLEEATLKNGVETFGRGNWKLILNAHKDIFDERTEVDLKDKWRNLTRYGCK